MKLSKSKPAQELANAKKLATQLQAALAKLPESERQAVVSSFETSTSRRLSLDGTRTSLGDAESAVHERMQVKDVLKRLIAQGGIEGEGLVDGGQLPRDLRDLSDKTFALIAKSEQPAQDLAYVRKTAEPLGGAQTYKEALFKLLERSSDARQAFLTNKPKPGIGASERAKVEEVLSAVIRKGGLHTAKTKFESDDYKQLEEAGLALISYSEQPEADAKWIRATLEPLTADNARLKSELLKTLGSAADARAAFLLR